MNFKFKVVIAIIIIFVNPIMAYSCVIDQKAKEYQKITGIHPCFEPTDLFDRRKLLFDEFISFKIISDFFREKNFDFEKFYFYEMPLCYKNAAKETNVNFFESCIRSDIWISYYTRYILLNIQLPNSHEEVMTRMKNESNKFNIFSEENAIETYFFKWQTFLINAKIKYEKENLFKIQ